MNDGTDEMIEARTRLAVAKEKLIRAALSLAATNFNQPADDPGWEADLYEEMLHSAVEEYTSFYNAVKLLEKKRA